MTEQNAIVYNVVIEGQNRKSLDVIALKKFLEGKKYHYSLLQLNPSAIEDNESLHKYIAKAAIDTIAELEDTIDQVLGLKSNEPEDKAETEYPEVEEAETDENQINLDEDTEEVEEVEDTKDEVEVEAEIKEPEQKENVLVVEKENIIEPKKIVGLDGDDSDDRIVL